MKEYKIVYSLEGNSFDSMVSDCLNDGWVLYGNPWSHQEPSGLVHLYQAINRSITYLVVEDEAAEAAEDTAKSDES